MIRVLMIASLIALLNAQEFKFRKLEIHNHYYAEGVHHGDFNRDGVPDIVNGPFWFEGPDFNFSGKHRYSPNEPDSGNVEDGWPLGRALADWADYVYDFDGDGWDDILVLPMANEAVYWYRNPRGGSGLWERYLVRSGIGHEIYQFIDVIGDSRPEILGFADGSLGIFQADRANPRAVWDFLPVYEDDLGWGHGLGAGDINGDGRRDILLHKGWLEQPADISGNWVFHPQVFYAYATNEVYGGAQMHAYDVDGDGDNDVITSLNAHGWGLSWFEQVKDGGNIAFTEHRLMGDSSETDTYGLAFSQLHAVQLADIDGDGLRDIITGKTYWAHPPDWGRDPDSEGDPVLFIFKLTREAGGPVFTPYLVDDNSGIGRQFVIADINRDSVPDIVSGSKHGLWVFYQEPLTAVFRSSSIRNQPEPGEEIFLNGNSIAFRPLDEFSGNFYGLNGRRIHLFRD